MLGINKMEQFVRTKLLLGDEKVERIFKSKVTVIGLGAVGSFATEILARVGVGNLTLVDFDVVQESNIKKQGIGYKSKLQSKNI